MGWAAPGKMYRTMQKIDAHQHFWKFDPVRDSWITEEMNFIQRDFFPHDLKPILKENGFDGCVAVQSDQSEAETEFLLALSAQHDFIKGVVGWVDLRADGLSARLNYFKAFKKLKGFRHILQGETDRGLMLEPEFKRGIALLATFGFTYDILIIEDQLQYIPELIKAFPDQKFVIDHLAKPNIKGQSITDWKKDMKALEKFDNLFCKISGMVTEADWKSWKQTDFIPYLDVVVEVFGTKRIMFGSDWPVCLVAGSYADVVSIVKDYFSAFTFSEQESLFGRNAVAFYDLEL